MTNTAPPKFRINDHVLYTAEDGTRIVLLIIAINGEGSYDGLEINREARFVPHRGVPEGALEFITRPIPAAKFATGGAARDYNMTDTPDPVSMPGYNQIPRFYEPSVRVGDITLRELLIIQFLPVSRIEASHVYGYQGDRATILKHAMTIAGEQADEYLQIRDKT